MASQVSYHSYGSTASAINYNWSGTNTLNQFASMVYVPVGFICQAIHIYWDGRGATAYGNHEIWDSAGNRIVGSPTVNATAGTDTVTGQQWWMATIADTYLAGGQNYYVGVWCNPSYARYAPQWNNGSVNSNLYTVTATSGVLSMSGASVSSAGVLACQLSGYTNGLNVNNAGTWTEAKAVWVNNGGTWTKSANGVWVNNGGTWQR